MEPGPLIEFRLDRQSGVPAYRQLIDQVRHALRLGLLRPGDQLRFEVAPAGAHFLLVGSVDGAGHASIYVPFEGSASVAIPPDQIYVSPGSVILDDSPGPERVFVWATEAPLSAATASAALSALGNQGAAAIRTTAKLPLDPPVPPLGQTSFLWEKDTP